MDNIIIIILISALIAYWWDTQRSNEKALSVSRHKCAAAGLQLLDSTVTRQRTWLRKISTGLQICRLYSFDYSSGTEPAYALQGDKQIDVSDFGDRKQGYIVLLGQQVVEIKLSLEE